MSLHLPSAAIRHETRLDRERFENLTRLIDVEKFENLEVDARRVECAPGRPHSVYFTDSLRRSLIHSPVAILE